jgi:hypothetical protein
MDTAQQLINRVLNWLKPVDEDSEPPEAEEPMTKGELIRTLIGLLVIDALFTFGFHYWADHDPRIASTFTYWVMIPMISVLAVGMAALQVYWYRHPEQAEEEGNA